MTYREPLQHRNLKWSMHRRWLSSAGSATSRPGENTDDHRVLGKVARERLLLPLDSQQGSVVTSRPWAFLLKGRMFGVRVIFPSGFCPAKLTSLDNRWILTAQGTTNHSASLAY